jgi:hypothetical protein
MPLTGDDMSKKRLNVLYTDIGRGHPHYLDGIVEILKNKYNNRIDLRIVDVFELSRGLSLFIWKLIRWLYHNGSQGGLLGYLYELIRRRRRVGGNGPLEKLAASGLRRFMKQQSSPTLVAHPVLVPMLADLTEVYYQHGEIAVPDEAIVFGAEEIFVPIKHATDKFTDKGIVGERMLTTGLCLEPELAANAEVCFQKRVKRLREKQIMCGAYFSSGAEPREHVEKIIHMLHSIEKNDGRGIIFCRKDGRLEHEVKQKTGAIIFASGVERDNVKKGLEKNNLAAISYNSRDEENDNVIRLFELFDYFVAPSHERTNWAVGLGLPMFILHPIIGTFSPLNRRFMLEHKVAYDIDTTDKAVDFADILSQLSENNYLLQMARNGYGRYEINGFEKIAHYLFSKLI